MFLLGFSDSDPCCAVGAQPLEAARVHELDRTSTALFFLSLSFTLVAQMVKRLPIMWETRVRSLGHSSTLAWKIPWTEEPGELQSMGSQRADTAEQLHFHFHQQ